MTRYGAMTTRLARRVVRLIEEGVSLAETARRVNLPTGSVTMILANARRGRL